MVAGFLRSSAIFLFAALVATPTRALVFGGLEFLQPNGNASLSDPIPVWVRLTLDATSESLVIGADGAILGGFSSNDLPSGFIPSDGGVSSAIIYNQLTFLSSDTNIPSPYLWEFSNQSSPLFSNLTLRAGESIDFLAGVFTPQLSVISPATYTLLEYQLHAGFVDTSGTAPSVISFLIANTCTANNCDGFQRVVGTLPIAPSSLLLMLGGLLVSIRSRIFRRRA
jgi:hypothetical protein